MAFPVPGIHLRWRRSWSFRKDRSTVKGSGFRALCNPKFLANQTRDLSAWGVPLGLVRVTPSLPIAKPSREISLCVYNVNEVENSD